MKKIKITYEKKMSNECWDRRVYITNDGKDWERVVNVIHNNPEEYKVIKVEHLYEK